MLYRRLWHEVVSLLRESPALQYGPALVPTAGEQKPREDCSQQFVLRMVAAFTVGNNCLDMEAIHQTPCDSAEVISLVAGLCWQPLVSFELAG